MTKKRTIRRALAVLALAAGVLGLLATSAPLPPGGEIRLSRAAACIGDAVEASWSLYPGTEVPVPDDVRMITAPAGALDDLPAGSLPSDEGTASLTVRRTGFVTLHAPDAFLAAGAAGVAGAACDEIGRQWTDDAAPGVHALGVDPIDGTVTVLLGGSGTRRAERLDATLATVERRAVPFKGVDVVAGPAGGTLTLGDVGDDGTVLVVATASDGAELWRDEIAPADLGAVDAWAVALARAPGGDVAAALSAVLADGTVRVHLRRYDDAGALLWERTVEAAGDASAFAWDVAIGPGGDAILAGTTTGEVAGPLQSVRDAYVASFAADGTAGWSLQRPGGTRHVAVAAGASGRILLAAGELVAMAPGGTVLWSVPPGPDEILEGVAETGSGAAVGLYLATPEIVFAEDPERWLSPVGELRVRWHAADGAVTAERALGSLGEDVVLAGPTAWPSQGADAVAIGGSTTGDLLVVRDEADVDRFDPYLVVLSP